MAACATVGVPETTPVDEFSERPAGRVGDTEKVGVELNAEGVRVLVAVIAIFTRVATVWVRGESDGGGTSHFTTYAESFV